MPYEPRPSQAERDMIVDRLRESVGAGSLTLDEFQERLDAAYRVETLSELLSLLPIHLSRRPPPTRRKSIATACVAVLIAAVIAIPVAIASIHSTPTVPASATRAATPLTVFRGIPTGDQVAVIDVDVSVHRLTLEVSQQDVTYPTCSNFRAVSSDGSTVGLAVLSPGDFATDVINDVDSCVESVTLLPAPLTSTCTLAGGPGGQGVTWEGFNQAAHAVLYEPLGFIGLVLAERWCVSINATNANNVPITLAQIPKGAYVALLLSPAYSWITGVSIEK